MLDEALQEQAALYAAGAMAAVERDPFELQLEFDPALRSLVASFSETAAAMVLASLPVDSPTPGADLRRRVLQATENLPQAAAESLVMTSPDGLVEWVNPAFTSLCGYTLDELRGRKLGPILQGAETDPAAAKRLREAVHARRPCVERLLNYRKDGSCYCVEIDMKPLFHPSGALRGLVARELEVAR